MIFNYSCAFVLLTAFCRAAIIMWAEGSAYGDSNDSGDIEYGRLSGAICDSITNAQLNEEAWAELAPALESGETARRLHKDLYLNWWFGPDYRYVVVCVLFCPYLL